GAPDRVLAAVQPVEQPDAVIAPPKRLELLLPKPVAVTRRRHVAVGRPVALDREHEPARLRWVARGHVEPRARRAPPRRHGDARRRERLEDILLDRAEGLARALGGGARGR